VRGRRIKLINGDEVDAICAKGVYKYLCRAGRSAGIKRRIRRRDRHMSRPSVNELPEFTDGTEQKCCMTCMNFTSWYDIFYQEDPEEPADSGECYVWHDDFEGDGAMVCKYWRGRDEG